MAKTKKTTTVNTPVTGTVQDEFTPAEYKAFLALPEDERYKLRVAVPHDGWTSLTVEACHEVQISPEERDAIAQGTLPCPRCHDGFYNEIIGGYAKILRDDGEVISRKVFHKHLAVCDCQIWKHIWKLTKRELPLAYQKFSLATLKPDLLNRLPVGVQQQEMDYVRQHESENFLFLGPSGTGKTTLAYALFRAAYDRSAKHLWSEDRGGLEYKDRRWIWRGNFNDLLNQFNAKQKEQKDNPVPDPEVTQQKIKNAARDGFRPVLIIEEVDKIELNMHRSNFLFHLIDETINAGGQLIMTTNLTMAEFRDNLTANEDIRTTGETILRRLTDHVHIRNYFEFYSG